MSGFLLDTEVVSELLKLRPRVAVSQWVEATDESLLYLSVITMGEIRRGVAMSGQARQRTRQEAWLVNDLRDRFEGRILRLDSGVADRWGLLSAHAQKQGVAISVLEGLLAATAIHHNLTFVTHDAGRLATMGIGVFDPWAGNADKQRRLQ